MAYIIFFYKISETVEVSVILSPQCMLREVVDQCSCYYQRLNFEPIFVLWGGGESLLNMSEIVETISCVMLLIFVENYFNFEV